MDGFSGVNSVRKPVFALALPKREWPTMSGYFSSNSLLSSEELLDMDIVLKTDTEV